MSDEEAISKLPGVGPAILEKLKEAGYNDIMTIAVDSPKNLAELAEIGEPTAAKIIAAAKKAADVGGFETGDVLLERRKTVAKLTSGSKSLDELMGGGFESRAITEFFGEFGSGKTQLCHQLAVNCQRSLDEGGLEGHTMIIDTEQTFRPERIVQMSEALELDPDEVLKKIHVARAFNSHHQTLLVDKATELAKEYPVRLLVVDSLTAHFRAEYIGRGALAERQQMLNKHMHDLLRFGDLNNAVIAVTNQVAAKPDAFFGDPTRPIGGHIVGHTATFRIYLRKSKGGKRIARLIDSPNLPEAEVLLGAADLGIHVDEFWRGVRAGINYGWDRGEGTAVSSLTSPSYANIGLLLAANSWNFSPTTSGSVSCASSARHVSVGPARSRPSAATVPGFPPTLPAPAGRAMSKDTSFSPSTSPTGSVPRKPCGTPRRSTATWWRTPRRASLSTRTAGWRSSTQSSRHCWSARATSCCGPSHGPWCMQATARWSGRSRAGGWRGSRCRRSTSAG